MPRELDDRGRLVAPGIVRDASDTPKSRGLIDINKFKPKELSLSQLDEYMQAYGISAPSYAYRQDTATWLSRLWDLPPNSPRVKEEVALITSGISRKGLVQEARRAQENYTTLEVEAENPGGEFIRIPEDMSEMTCDNCVDKAGEIGTLAYHRDVVGMPGPAS